MLRRVALVRTDVSEEPGSSFIRVTRIGELGTTTAATSNRRTLRRNTKWCRRRQVPPKRRFLQEPHGVTSQKTHFFTANVVHRSIILFTLMIEAIRSSETLVLARNTWRHIPEDGILYSHRCENIHSYILNKPYMRGYVLLRTGTGSRLL
jgi:hypothetical protein